MRVLVLIFWLISFSHFSYADEKPDVQIGLSSDTVEIASNFDGTDLVIFGSIENGDRELLRAGRYDIVVTLLGPNEEVTVRRKEKRAGIWVNGASLRFGDVPSSYSVATTRPLSDIAVSDEIKILELGLDNISVFADDTVASAEEIAEFRHSLARLKVKQELYLERIGGVEFLSPTLFRAKLAVPANVPIGNHFARAFLFQDGQFVNSQFSQMNVQKVGFEQYTYELAHENGLLYGLIAVLIAIVTGWMASLIFGKD